MLFEINNKIIPVNSDEALWRAYYQQRRDQLYQMGLHDKMTNRDLLLQMMAYVYNEIRDSMEPLALFNRAHLRLWKRIGKVLDPNNLL